MTVELQQAAAEIQARIKQLQDLDPEPLQGAMKDLKAALMQNPAACSLLLPEDIGEMVAALRKITGEAVVTATVKKASKKKSAKEFLSEEAAEDF